MTTIKNYTDIEQAKKLAEILPLESADMCLTFVNNKWNPVYDKADTIYQLQKDCYEPDYTKDEYIDFDEFEPKVVHCWSLAALLNIISVYTLQTNIDGTVFIVFESSKKSIISNDCDNPVDACVEMILKLNEFKML